MVSPYQLASRQSVPWKSHAGVVLDEVPVLTLESLDGSRKIVLDGVSGWTHLPGATGLEMPPVDVVTSSVPGVAGSMLQEVRVEERPVFIPIDAASPDSKRVTHQAMLNSIRSLVDPLSGQFRVVCGDRQLTLVYTEGLEGSFGASDFGLYWRKFGLKALACQPFAEGRTEQSVEFRLAVGGQPFLGVAGGTDVPWGTRQITSSALIGDNMRVLVESEVPVYPTVELVNSMDSFTGAMELEDPSQPGTGWSVSVPGGVLPGYTLRLVTDPRSRSIRMGVGDPATNPAWTGELAAGLVERGSTLRPFYPGVNLMNVAAPGGTEDTRIRITWRNLYRSLW
jgi:hypothetical protein